MGVKYFGSQLFGNQNYSKYLLLCSTEVGNTNRFERIKSFLFWVNYPFKYLYLIYILKSTFKTESKYLIITNLSIKYMFCDICKQV